MFYRKEGSVSQENTCFLLGNIREVLLSSLKLRYTSQNLDLKVK